MSLADAQTSLANFLEAAAAKQPTPGGGSVAAVAGALAASMGEMVLQYSVGKKQLAQFAPELQSALAELGRARKLLLQLMIEDQVGFETLTAARKLPAEHPTRQAEFDSAVLACIRVPQAIGATALVMLEIAEQIVDKVNPFLLSDLAVCADLAMATVRCAGYNVRVNLPDVGDAKSRGELEAAMKSVQASALAIIKRLSPRIWER